MAANKTSRPPREPFKRFSWTTTRDWLCQSGAIAISCVAIHPGTVQTRFTEKYVGRHPSVPADAAATNILNVLNGLTPDDTGGFFDWRGDRVPW